MIKGERAGSERTVKMAAQLASTCAQPPAATLALASIEALAAQADAALLAGEPEGRVVYALRCALRPKVAGIVHAMPTLPARLWLALMGHYLSDDHHLRGVAPDTPLTLLQASLGRESCLGWVTGVEAVQDHDDVSLHGWGEYEEREGSDSPAA